MTHAHSPNSRRTGLIGLAVACLISAGCATQPKTPPTPARATLPPVATAAATPITACPVTIPKQQWDIRGSIGGQDGRPIPTVGTPRFWTYLEAGGITTVLSFQLEPDGKTRIKWPWFFAGELDGQLSVKGRRLDEPGAAWVDVFSNFNEAIGGAPPDTRVLTSYGAFPSPGCWEVQAAMEGERMTFVTNVITP
jgi:hypothetical protein